MVPTAINQGDAREHGLQIFLCDDYFVAIDLRKGNGYFWEAEKLYPR